MEGLYWAIRVVAHFVTNLILRLLMIIKNYVISSSQHLTKLQFIGLGHTLQWAIQVEGNHSILGYKGWGTLCSGLYRLRDTLYWTIRVVAHFVVGYTG